MRLSERALWYMRKYETLELPPQFVHGIRTSTYRRTRQYMDCQGFVLWSEFPNNIAMMQNGDVIYCLEFLVPEEKFGPYSIIGLRFNNYKSWFNRPIDSKSIGLVKVSNLQFEKTKFSCDDLVSQCFIFALPKNISSHPLPTAQLKNAVHKSSDVLRTVGARFILSEGGIGHYSNDKWDIASKEVPGRHTKISLL